MFRLFRLEGRNWFRRQIRLLVSVNPTRRTLPRAAAQLVDPGELCESRRHVLHHLCGVKYRLNHNFRTLAYSVFLLPLWHHAIFLYASFAIFAHRLAPHTPEDQCRSIC